MKAEARLHTGSSLKAASTVSTLPLYSAKFRSRHVKEK